MKPTAAAFIPARSGSKRVTDKNVRPLHGHPLLAYAISSALDSGVFETVVCATDSERYADIARHYGAEVPALRPTTISGDQSPDIEWVLWLLDVLEHQGRRFDAFSILRPTNPFRTADTIRRAWSEFTRDRRADSLRAVEKCRQHPGKMWVVRGERMHPLFPFDLNGTPWHSNQYAALPEVFVQNASLEIAWTTVATDHRSISGETIIPFVTQGTEGIDINNPEDWTHAEALLARGEIALPAVSRPAFPPTAAGGEVRG